MPRQTPFRRVSSASYFRRRTTPPIASRPVPISIQVDGSGTVVPMSAAPTVKPCHHSVLESHVSDDTLPENWMMPLPSTPLSNDVPLPEREPQPQ